MNQYKLRFLKGLYDHVVQQLEISELEHEILRESEDYIILETADTLDREYFENNLGSVRVFEPGILHSGSDKLPFAYPSKLAAFLQNKFSSFDLSSTSQVDSGFQELDSEHLLNALQNLKNSESLVQEIEELSIIPLSGYKAWIGIRTTDSFLGNRSWKSIHFKGSIDATIAHSLGFMLRKNLKRKADSIDVYNPFCGAGTIVAELQNLMDINYAYMLDSNYECLSATSKHLKKAESKNENVKFETVCADILNTPIEKKFDLVVADPPWGLQIDSPKNLTKLYKELLKLAESSLKDDGVMGLIVNDIDYLIQLINKHTDLRVLDWLEVVNFSKHNDSQFSNFLVIIGTDSESQ